MRISLVEKIGLLGGFFSRPSRVTLLLENDGRIFRGRPAHALIAFDRRGRRAVSGNRQHVKLAVGSERSFSLAALDQRVRRHVAGVLGPRLQRAEPALVLAAGRSDATALLDRNRAVSEKGLHPGGIDDL